MTIAFPPKPVYPEAIDTDFTLFLVHNTTESLLASDNEPWSNEIEIIPVGEDEYEVWADNGFGNIDGELFYYDSVAKDSNGKVFKFLRLTRNLGGTHTHFVKANGRSSQVRGFVVAEHHNQLAQAVFQVEKFIGINFDTDVSTLDFRIRCLRAVPFCIDDFNCPTVTFNFEVVENEDEEDDISACRGVTYAFNVEIDGSFNNFILDFGDGTTTSNDLFGTHVFPVDITPDPVVTVSNTNCQICATPSNRSSSNDICIPGVEAPFLVALPVLPNLPNFTIPAINIEQPFDFPPTIFPCVNISVPSFPAISISIPTPDFGISINVPSQIFIVPPIPSFIQLSPINLPTYIQFSPVNIPNTINFGPVNIPTLISFSPVNIPTLINFGPAPDFCSEIRFGPAPNFSTINFGPVNFPSLISIEFAALNIPSIQFAAPPTISVDWGTPPTISANVVISCPSAAAGMAMRSMNDMLGINETPSFEDNELSAPVLGVQWDDDMIGIPKEIKIVAPEKMPEIMVVHDLPKKIMVESLEIPPIKIEHNIPTVIKLQSDGWPTSIKLDSPTFIKLDTSDAFPITLSVPKDFPSIIRLEAIGIPEKIQVEGIPNVIRVEHDIPQTIDLVLPENPKVEMVFNGPPIEMKVNLVTDLSEDDDENNGPCVMIVPCKPRK